VQRIRNQDAQRLLAYLSVVEMAGQMIKGLTAMTGDQALDLELHS
jgi:hypothetical protein